MRKTGLRRGVFGAVAVVAALAAADDLAWMWDASGRTAPAPAVASADIASVPPVTVSVKNAAPTDTWTCNWLDSDGFGFDGLMPGLTLIFR